MKKIITLALICMAGIMPTMAQKSSKGKSSQSSNPPTKFIERKDRTFAERLGGYYVYDYKFVESTANLNKKEWKEYTKSLIFSTYDSAYAHLPKMPNPADVNTREKLADYMNIIECWVAALYKHDASVMDRIHAAGDSINARMMANAKAAYKGQPYDTVVHIDPKSKRYLALLDKISAHTKPLSDRHNKYYCFQDFSDVEDQNLLVNFSAIMPDREYFKVFAPLNKQMCREWFASPECKKIHEMDAQLIARAQTENNKKTPQWFVDGRKAELPYVEAYNQRQIERWIKKCQPYMEKTKADILKAIAFYHEADAIRGNDPGISYEYYNAKMSAWGAIISYMGEYLSWLDFLQAVPMIQTPTTYEGKKFKGYEYPEIYYWVNGE